jgi:hypothetical protein
MNPLCKRNLFLHCSTLSDESSITIETTFICLAGGSVLIITLQKEQLRFRYASKQNAHMQARWSFKEDPSHEIKTAIFSLL